MCKRFHLNNSLQSRRFLTKTRRYIDPSAPPLKSVFDSSQLSGSINVQDGRTTSFLKTIPGSRSKRRLLCRPFEQSHKGLFEMVMKSCNCCILYILACLPCTSDLLTLLGKGRQKWRPSVRTSARVLLKWLKKAP